ncbi:MAG TPA: hypothetical protein G4O15_00055 [Dehalococcoidia bacterium]|nr:hypothetical protein [Dehalococcoidia bacterium]
MTILKDFNLKKIPGNIKPDSKRRVVLPVSLVSEDIVYHIYSNEAGQILLDPQVMVSASEAWLFRNPEALASVKRGLANAAEGRVSKVDLDEL